MKKSLWPSEKNPIITFMRILLSNLMDCCEQGGRSSTGDPIGSSKTGFCSGL
jgi:hypothetical protein